MQSSAAKQAFLSFVYKEKFISSSYRTLLLFSHYLHANAIESKRLGLRLKTTLQKSVTAKTEKEHGLTRSSICGGRDRTFKTQLLPIVKRYANNDESNTAEPPCP